MTEQNNDVIITQEASTPNGNGGGSKKVFLGVAAVVIIAAVLFFVYRSTGIRSPKALMKTYQATAKKMEQQVAYQKEMQKKYLNQAFDSNTILTIKDMPKGAIPFSDAKLDLGMKNDPAGKRLQMSMGLSMSGRDFITVLGELNDNELLIDLGEYSERLIALPTKDFGAKFNDFARTQGSEANSMDPTLNISYSELMNKIDPQPSETPQEYKDALLKLVDGVKLDKIDEGYRMIIPNENVRSGLKGFFEAMKKDPRLAGMDATQNREDVFGNLIKKIEESTDELTLDVLTKVADGIVTESNIRLLKNGEEEIQTIFNINDTKDLWKDWTWMLKSAKDESVNVNVSGQGLLTKEKTDYSLNVSVSEQMKVSIHLAYGNPDTSGEAEISANLEMNGEESMSFILGGKYNNENDVRTFVSDVGTVRMKNEMSDEDSEIHFSVESETKPTVESFHVFEKEKHMMFDATKEDNDAFFQAIIGMFFMRMMGM